MSLSTDNLKVGDCGIIMDEQYSKYIGRVFKVNRHVEDDKFDVEFYGSYKDSSISSSKYKSYYIPLSSAMEILYGIKPIFSATEEK